MGLCSRASIIASRELREPRADAASRGIPRGVHTPRAQDARRADASGKKPTAYFTNCRFFRGIRTTALTPPFARRYKEISAGSRLSLCFFAFSHVIHLMGG